MKKLLVILGPTTTGKTDLALSLARQYNGELVACDSRQIYQNLDIGTGKLPSFSFVSHNVNIIQKSKNFWEINGTKIWMYDVVSPKHRFTVDHYFRLAKSIIAKIEKQNKLPIVVGGSGLYLKALVDGLPNLKIPTRKALGKELSMLSKEELQNKLKYFSIERWEKLNSSDQQNPRRLLRSIELIIMNPYIVVNKNTNGLKSKFDILKIGLTAPPEVLKRSILIRLQSRLDQGLIEECKMLIENGVSYNRMEELGLEYKYASFYLRGQLLGQDFINTLSIKIWQFAKRQRTWFKREKNIHWFDITQQNFLYKVEKLVQDWYNSPGVCG